MNKEFDGRKSEKDSYIGSRSTKNHLLKKGGIAVLSVVLLVAVLSVFDNIVDPPAWWRFERQQDKKAILDYVEANYPETIIRKGGKFPLQLPAGPFEPSIMCFELDGVDFSIYAQDGKVNHDTYYEAKAEKYIRENFVDSFMNEKGLSPNIKISFVNPPGQYGMLRKDVLSDVHSFKGSIWVTITQAHIVGVSTPQEVGWFYEFYQFWIQNCDLPNCVVYLHYRQNNDYSTDESDYVVWFKRGEKTFSNEDEFYNEFTT